MNRPSAALAFRDPAAPGSGELIAYLDTVTDLRAVRAYKELTFHLLGPVSGARVLDVGCGTGDDVRVLAAVAGAAGLVGCDLSPAMVAEAVARATRDGVGAEFVVADAHELPFPSGAFGASRADRVLQHLADPALAIAEMVRVTASGGRIVVSDPDWTSLRITPATPAAGRLAAACLARARNPCVSDAVDIALRAAGATEVCRHRTGARFTSLAVADAVFELHHALPGAERLCAELVASDAAGSFAAEIDGFVVCGTAP